MKLFVDQGINDQVRVKDIIRGNAFGDYGNHPELFQIVESVGDLPINFAFSIICPVGRSASE